MVATYGATRVAVVGSVGTIEVVNVFNVLNGAGVVAITQAIGDAFAEHFGPTLSNSYAFGHAHGVDMSDEAGETYTYPLDQHELGGGSSAVELGLAAVVRWVDSISGRKYRPGRTFLGPLPQSAVTDLGLTLHTTARDSISDAAYAFVGAVSTAVGGPLVVVHGLGTPAQQMAPVTDASVSAQLAHLDSRRK